jgi:ABC-type uncharacterized transport system permease subunit
MPTHQLLSIFGLTCFALASMAYLQAFRNGALSTGTARAAFGLFLLATLTNIGLLAAWPSLVSDLPGVTLATAISILAIGGHAILQTKLLPVFIAPLATLMLLVQFFMAPAAPGVGGPPPPTGLLTVHVAAAMIGQACAIIAFAFSAVFLWQQSLLKRKLINQLPDKSPALDAIERWFTLALWIGFSFLTVSLLTGAFFAPKYQPESNPGLDLKIIWAVVIWVWYLAILLAKNVFNRAARVIARMSLVGFLLLAVSFFGIGFFRPLGGP